MDVTRSNFNDAFELIKAKVDDVDFISIDAEFSGLSTIKSTSLSYNTPEDKYSRLKNGSNKLLLIQYGICLFKWSDKGKQYKAMPFNFYIFPRPYKRIHNDVIFACQSSSIDFLAKNGFDFNKLFHQGVSFMSPWEEAKAREKFKKDLFFITQNDMHNKRTMCHTPTNVSPDVEKKSSIFIPKDQKDFIENVCEEIEKFMKDNFLKTYDLLPCTPFQRTLIYECLEEKYPKGLYLKSVLNEKNEQIIRGIKITANEELSQKKIEEENLLLDEIIGFTKVMKLLSNCRKPLIGHNMLMDLFLTITNFFSLPPENLSEFKSLLLILFSTFFDTKLLCSVQPLSSKVSGTSLEKLKTLVDENVLPSPVVKLSDKLDDHAKSKNDYHQAGYDAYCTGLVFISLVRCLADHVNLKLDRIDFSCQLLKPFQNRIFNWGIKDIQYIDLEQLDVVPSCTGIFYVSHPKGWDYNDIEKVFAPFCSISSHVIKISDTETYVTLIDNGKVDVVLKGLVLNQNPAANYFVASYNNYKSGNKDNFTPLNSKSNKKRYQSKDNSSNSPPHKKKSAEVEDGEISSDTDSEGSDYSITFDQPNQW